VRFLIPTAVAIALVGLLIWITWKRPNGSLAPGNGAGDKATDGVAENGKPAVVLPPGRRMAEGATLVDISGKKFYDRIECVKDGIPVRFLLIQKKRGSGPPSFYVMEKQVWIGLFRSYAKYAEHASGFPYSKDAGLLSAWKERARSQGENLDQLDDQLPATRVTVDEAFRFAWWLGGNLPSDQQWDKAAGAHDHETGSFTIAVGEESIYGCQEMAGKAREWTRSLGVPFDGQEGPVENPGDEHDIKLRGGVRAYEYESRSPKSREQEPYRHFKPDISFRVVLELDGLP
jgi:formylglycine-generating enzyme required for sulfatase activity